MELYIHYEMIFFASPTSSISLCLASCVYILFDSKKERKMLVYICVLMGSSFSMRLVISSKKKKQLFHFITFDATPFWRAKNRANIRTNQAQFEPFSLISVWSCRCAQTFNDIMKFHREMLLFAFSLANEIWRQAKMFVTLYVVCFLENGATNLWFFFFWINQNLTSSYTQVNH